MCIRVESLLLIKIINKKRFYCQKFNTKTITKNINLIHINKKDKKIPANKKLILIK